MKRWLAYVTTWVLGLAAFAPLRAAPPALLVKAVAQWVNERQELAFTQQTRFFSIDGSVKEERTERYDPSRPDRQRWQLIEMNGRPATTEERAKWEAKKNRRPRKRIAKEPTDYVDLDHAVLVQDAPASASYEIRLRQEAARLLGVEKIAAIVTIDKTSGSLVHIAAALHQPTRVLLGLAKITDLDVDVSFEPWEENSTQDTGEVEAGSAAHVALSRLGFALEYNWSDFKRVTVYPAGTP